jgi:hypothetical protein
MTQMDLAPILEVVNDTPNDPATAIGGDGGVKVNRAMGAVRAGERAGDCTFEWF